VRLTYIVPLLSTSSCLSQRLGMAAQGGGHRAAVSLLASAGCDVACGRALSTLPPDRSGLFGSRHAFVSRDGTVFLFGLRPTSPMRKRSYIIRISSSRFYQDTWIKQTNILMNRILS
jgi:hypothetical protein